MTLKRRVIALSLLLVIPNLALAHSPIKGLNYFYNGLLHPLLVPAHLLLIVGLGLLFGQQGMRKIQLPLLVYVIAVAIGLAGTGFLQTGQAEPLVMAAAAAVGILVAASPRFPLYLYVLIGAAAGFSLGFDSSQETLFGRDKFVALAGTAVGIYFFSLYPISLAEFCNKKPWLKVGVRVVGSWVAASALLVLALAFTSVKP
jgi:hydrogenase/urease accessory protein HupE